MSTSTMKILCRYQYDPLDRLTGLKPAEHLDTQRFYQDDELVNEIEGQVELTLLRHEAQPLAQRITNANVTETTLLATDQQRSVLQTLAGTDTQPMAYTAYGHRSAESGLSSLLGFNGERPDPFTGHYLLGQGNRAFNPVLMRFNSPDELSPFGDGGINAYAYCGGDPVNRYDPSGNIYLPRAKSLGLTKTPPPITHPSPHLNASNQSSRIISPLPAREPSPLNQRTVVASKAQKNLIPPYKNGNSQPTKKLSTYPAAVRTRKIREMDKKQSATWEEYYAKNPDTPDRADPYLKSLLKKRLEKLHAKKAEADKLGLTGRPRDSFISTQRIEVMRTKRRINRSRLENLPQERSQVRQQT